MTDPTTEIPSWESLGETWKTGGDYPSIVPAIVRERVESATRRMGWWLAAEVSFTLVALGVSGWILTVRASTDGLLIASDIWIVTAIVWAFALVSRRGLWRPLSATTEAYLTLARARVIRRIWNVAFATALLVVQTGIMSFVGGSQPVDPLSRLARLLGLAAWTAWVVWEWRRATKELRHLDRLRAELIEP